MLLDDRRFRDLILEMSRWTARIRIKLLVAVSVDRLRLCALQLLLLLLLAQAWFAYHLVTFFVHEQFALDALESLPPEAPDPILAERAEGSLQIKPMKSITLYYFPDYLCQRRIAVSREMKVEHLSLTKKHSDKRTRRFGQSLRRVIIKFKYPVLDSECSSKNSDKVHG